MHPASPCSWDSAGVTTPAAETGDPGLITPGLRLVPADRSTTSLVDLPLVVRPAYWTVCKPDGAPGATTFKRKGTPAACSADSLLVVSVAETNAKYAPSGRLISRKIGLAVEPRDTVVPAAGAAVGLGTSIVRSTVPVGALARSEEHTSE